MTADKYRNQGLQALRGVLVMLVYLQHALQFGPRFGEGPLDMLNTFGFGSIGVLTFFALSAFLIGQKSGDPPSRYLIDRARRIFPGFWLSVLISALIFELSYGFTGVNWQLFFLLPIGEPASIPGQHWTLYYEVLLYLVIFAIARVSPRCVGPVIVLWGIAAWIWQGKPYGGYFFPGWDQLMFPVFATYFAAGVVASWITRWEATRIAARSLRFRRWKSGALFCAASCFALMVPLSSSVSVYTFLYSGLDPAFVADFVSFYYVFSAYFLIRAATLWPADGYLGRLCAWLGNLSYGIYLQHLIWMVVMVDLLEPLKLTDSFWLGVALIFCAALPPSLLFGLLEYRLQVFLKPRARRFLEALGRWRGQEPGVQRV